MAIETDTVRIYNSLSVHCRNALRKLHAELASEPVCGSFGLYVYIGEGFSTTRIFTLWHPDNTYIRDLAAAINGAATEPDDRAEMDPNRESLP